MTVFSKGSINHSNLHTTVLFSSMPAKINANKIPKMTAKINGHIDCCEKSVEPNIPRSEKCKNILFMTEDSNIFVNIAIMILDSYFRQHMK